MMSNLKTKYRNGDKLTLKNQDEYSPAWAGLLVVDWPSYAPGVTDVHVRNARGTRGAIPADKIVRVFAEGDKVVCTLPAPHPDDYPYGWDDPMDGLINRQAILEVVEVTDNAGIAVTVESGEQWWFTNEGLEPVRTEDIARLLMAGDEPADCVEQLQQEVKKQAERLVDLEAQVACLQIETDELKAKQAPPRTGWMAGAGSASGTTLTSKGGEVVTLPTKPAAPVFTEYELGLIRFVFANLCGDLQNEVYTKAAAFELYPRPGIITYGGPGQSPGLWKLDSDHRLVKEQKYR